jgi:drug/metabolite transporter (DMT)-like permease
MKPSPRLAAIVIVVLVLIWSTTWGVVKIGLEGMPPLLGAGLRFAVASVVLFIYALWKKVPIGRAPYEKRLWVSNAVFSFIISFPLVYWAEQWVPTGLTALLFSTFPLFVALLAHFMLPAERLVRNSAFGIVLGFVGVATIFSEDFDRFGGENVLFASAILLLSPLSAALGNVLVKRYGGGVPAVALSAPPMGMAALVLCGASLLLESDRSVIWNAKSIGAVLYLAIVGSAITFGLFFWMLRHFSATKMSLIAYAIPVLATAIGALAFSEPVTARLILGAGLVVFGIFVTNRAAHPD